MVTKVDESQLRFFPSALPNIPEIYGTGRKIPGLDKARWEAATWFISRRGGWGCCYAASPIHGMDSIRVHSQLPVKLCGHFSFFFVKSDFEAEGAPL